MHRLAVIVALAACHPPLPDDSDAPDTDAPDTDAPDTDTDTDAPDTDTDPGDVADLRVIPVDPTGFAGATLGLFPIDTYFFYVLDEEPRHTVTLGDDGAYSVTFTPGDADLVTPPWAEGLQVASYALAAYDGEPDADGLIGVTRFDAVYVVGEIPQPYAEIGLRQGWNALAGDDEGPPRIGDVDDIALEANLLPSAQATASGTWDAVDGDLIGALSTEDDTIAIGATAAGAAWAVTASGEPAASTIFDSGDVRVAGFRIAAWADADASGGWSAGDGVTAVGETAEGVPAWLSWGAPVANVNEAHILVTRGGFRVGWSAVYGTEGVQPLDEAAAAALVLVPGAL